MNVIGVDSMLIHRWATVVDGEPTLSRRWFNVSCLLSWMHPKYAYVRNSYIYIKNQTSKYYYVLILFYFLKVKYKMNSMCINNIVYERQV